MLASWWLAAALSTASANDVVVRAGLDEATALQQVTTDAAHKPQTEKAVTLPELVVGRSPIITGDGSVELCAVPPMTSDAVHAAMDKAEKDISYVAYTDANADLDQAMGALGCLREMVDPAQAARLYYLRGVIAYERGDEDGAYTDFVQARTYSADLGWDPEFPPDAQPKFEEAAQEAARHAPTKLQIVPLPRDSKLFVDGKEAKDAASGLDVTPGEHLVQLVGASITTVRVHLGGAPATLLLPSALTEDDAWAVGDPTTGAAISAMIAIVAGNGTNVWVALPTGTWSGTAGSPTWTQVASHDPYAGRRTTKTWLVRGGVGLAGIGAVVGGVSWLQAASIAHANNQPGAAWDPYTDDYQPKYLNAVGRVHAGEVIGLAGAAVVGLGFAIPLGHVGPASASPAEGAK